MKKIKFLKNYSRDVFSFYIFDASNESFLYIAKKIFKVTQSILSNFKLF